ncbi:hypothetical protein [Sutcliffiella deserti]|uniref:hypothetical protein n=1 Tax=Sutcliffiella deserti TaxID=2875501 RepID=UPI001CC16F18|nr:hypothetical protein [Sutcliffiella deserti]
MELLELYYKKYTGKVQAPDYVKWAIHSLYKEIDTPNLRKLAGMQGQLNIFEVEKMFHDAMNSIQKEAPSKEQCVDYHLKNLHSQLLMPVKNAMEVVKEIYDCTIEHDLFEEQMKWQEVSDAIDDFQHGDNFPGYTLENINKIIVSHARRFWHMKISDINFEQLIGQKVTGIDSDGHFIITLEKGAIIIECPWRIRDAEAIMYGETDIRSNQLDWKPIKEVLIGKTIIDVQLYEHCPLLIVQCDNIFLDVFHASSYFDGWTLTDEEDFYLFSMHGGTIA